MCRPLFYFFCSSALILLDNRIESLIQKADQVLSSLSHRAEGELCPGGSAESTTPPATPGSPSSSLTFSFHSSFTHLSYRARGRWTLLRGEVKSSLINFFTELTSSSFFLIKFYSVRLAGILKKSTVINVQLLLLQSVRVVALKRLSARRTQRSCSSFLLRTVSASLCESFRKKIRKL